MFNLNFIQFQVAKWKQLTAKIVTTKDRFKDAEGSQREGSPIPGIELHDIVEGKLFLNRNHKKEY